MNRSLSALVVVAWSAACGAGILAGSLSGCGSEGSVGQADAGDDPGEDGAAGDANDQPFSFFVTSLQTMREQSGSEDGFGGDLGGLAGADRICQTAAENVGFGDKTWRAFLSVTAGPNGGPVHAIDRIGEGPWFDRNGRLIAGDLDGLLQARPAGDPQAVADLADEFGQPLSLLGDAHDIVTASDRMGRLASTDPASTCQDWTSAVGPGSEFRVTCGHSFPRSPTNGTQWIADHPLRGCAPGVNLVQNGPGEGDCIGCSGGYGGIYCFALTP